MDDNWEDDDSGITQFKNLDVSGKSHGIGRGKLFADINTKFGDASNNSTSSEFKFPDTYNSSRGNNREFRSSNNGFSRGGRGNHGYSAGDDRNRDETHQNDSRKNYSNGATNSFWKPDMGNDEQENDRSENFGRGGRGNFGRGSRGDRGGGHRGFRNGNQDDNSGGGFGSRGYRNDEENDSSNFRGRGQGDRYQRGRGRGGSYSNRDDSNNDDRNRGTWGVDNDGNDDQRDFRGRGGRGGGRFQRGDRRGFNDRGDQGDSNRGDEGSRQGGFGGRTNRNDNSGDGEEKKERPPLYIPPQLEDDKLFDGIPCGINFSRYKNIAVKITGHDAPKPIKSFEESNLRDLLITNVKKANYTVPTSVQQYAIPAIMARRDLMACAQTGSGKTAAFLLPILHNLMSSGELEGASFKETQEPYAIIMAPTRELAIQIHKEARKFSYSSIVQTAILYGGTSVGYQLRDLRKGVHILVATPGRLLDVVERMNAVSFSKLRYLVLDEGDRMLDMGFIDCIRTMMNNSTMPPKNERTTLMFSATFAESVQRLANEFLNDYLFLSVGIVGGANDDVRQEFVEVKRNEKLEILKKILMDNPSHSVIIFVEMKRQADFICSVLCSQEPPFKATSIHGDRLQQQREEALGDFKSGKFPLLVATGVASRGLDINGVDHVINYDLPKEIDEYVHRIGRTGRVGNIGRSTSFFDIEHNKDLVHPLIKILKDAQQEIPDWLLQHGEDTGLVSGNFSRSGQFGGRDIRSFKSDCKDQWDQPSSNCDDETWD